MLYANSLLLVLALLVSSAAACCASNGSTNASARAAASALSATMLVLLTLFATYVPANAVEGFNTHRGRGRESPLDHQMSSYDGVRLRTKCPDGWRHPPCGLPYYHPSRLSESLVQGHGAPDIKPPPSEPDHGPETTTVDGRPGSPHSKFMFAYNQCRPECCPSTYSCDHGCVCTTPEQRRFLQRRGTNHSQEAF